MAIKGITFSSPLILALLAGHKTQTRRIIKPASDVERLGNNRIAIDKATNEAFVTPYAIGDQLYVRETLQRTPNNLITYVADELVMPLWQ